jgi:hypothetical protein
MKHFIFVLTLLAIVSLAACSIQVSTLTQTTTSDTATDSPAAAAIPTTASIPTTANQTTEETKIRDLAEDFGKRLQAVSLLGPNVTQEMRKQYSEFVSPALLEIWMNDVLKAPGRMVSSPWPDRIEITTLSKAGSDRYEITGFVIEVTSTEAGIDNTAAKIPVRMIVQRVQEGWLITEYTEER